MGDGERGRKVSSCPGSPPTKGKLPSHTSRSGHSQKAHGGWSFRKWKHQWTQDEERL